MADAALRTLDQIYEAGAATARDHPPLTEAQVIAKELLLAACKPEAKAA